MAESVGCHTMVYHKVCTGIDGLGVEHINMGLFLIALDSISNSKRQQLVLLTGLRPKLASNQYRASYWIVGPP